MVFDMNVRMKGWKNTKNVSKTLTVMGFAQISQPYTGWLI